MKKKGYFTKLEIGIWVSSVALILTSFLIFDRSNYLNMIASLIGTTSLILCAKGNPLGQVLIIIFAALYAYISWEIRYYSELITYAFMTLPMAIFSLVSWLKNPFEKGKAEVRVNNLTKKEIVFSFFLSGIVTIIFYFILKALNTASLMVSTISIFTSFLAGYYTFRRSELLALAYGFNDIVLIVLWTIATISSIEYLSIVICFAVFLVNDTYTFINWRKMKKRQAEIK
ncbi:MAG: nicotinamide mononucleotide transporter [Clostridia bacterium]|nr:nicotinamide mononucleotide transporter [Clostridia bacterium]